MLQDEPQEFAVARGQHAIAGGEIDRAKRLAVLVNEQAARLFDDERGSQKVFRREPPAQVDIAFKRALRHIAEVEGGCAEPPYGGNLADEPPDA